MGVKQFLKKKKKTNPVLCILQHNNLIFIQMKEDTPTADWSDVKTTDAFTTKLSVPDLDSEKKYKFRVAAVNDVGQGDFVETTLSGSPSKMLCK